MLYDRCEIFLLDFMPFGPCPKHGCFKIVGVGVGGEEVRVIRNMLGRDDSCWLCMEFEIVFFTRNGIFAQGSSAFFSCVDYE